jgi:hypothetical protein
MIDDGDDVGNGAGWCLMFALLAALLVIMGIGGLYVMYRICGG